MLVNGKEVVGDSFAFDGCHKIYICENADDEKMMVGYGYDILPISELEKSFEISCDLRFISNAKLNKYYVEQFEDAVFEYNQK